MQKNDERRRISRNINRKKREKKHFKEMKAQRRGRVKLYFMVVVFFMCFMYLAYIIIKIKVVDGENYEAKAITQLINGGTQSEEILYPNRGDIVDRNMMPIGVSTKVYDVYIDPRKLVNDNREIKKVIEDPITGEEITKKIPVIEDTLEKINMVIFDELEKDPAECLVITGEELNDEGEVVKLIPIKDNSHEIIARGISSEKMTELQKLNATHVYFEAKDKRTYINDTYASSVIGFIRGDTIMGLEKQYNKYLTGSTGRSFRTFSSEGNIQVERVDEKDGDTVVTTLDLAIQKISEDAALKYGEIYDAKNASVIVMQPNTGEILSMAAYPSFDLNDPMNIESVTKSQHRENWKELNEEEKYKEFDKIWRNYNITNTFEPGSIFKPVTIGAALEENIITVNTTFECLGNKVVSGIKIDCHKTSGHGIITLKEAIAYSCNVAMMEIGEKMGRDIFYKYQKDFGFGEKTKIDLPAEISAKLLLHALSELNPVELATSSFGQRFNATPLQDIVSFAATINGGYLMRPYIVSQVVDVNGVVIKENKPIVEKTVISQETSDYLRTSMESVISEGTGVKAKIEGWSVGGKTGTGEQGIKGTEEYHHSLTFIGYFPVENPEYVVMVALDNIEYIEGVTTPAPMLKEVIQGIIKYKSIPPSYDSEDIENLYTDSEMVTMGDYVGKSLQEVTRDLNKLSLGYELIGGSGTVVSTQFPDPETKMTKDSVVLLTISNGEEEYEMTTIPNVVGLTQLQAEEMLLALNLVPSPQIKEEISSEITDDEQTESTTENNEDIDEKEKYIVYTQMPEQDKRVMVGTEIKIKIEKIIKDIPNVE